MGADGVSAVNSLLMVLPFDLKDGLPARLDRGRSSGGPVGDPEVPPWPGSANSSPRYSPDP